MSSIPADQLVSVIPGVLGAGGNPLSLNSVFLTPNNAVPIDSEIGYVAMAFPTLQSVQDFFGVGTVEALMAAKYFSGFTGATVLPGTLYFTQYNTAAVAAYLRGGSLGSMTLAQLQALSGTIIVGIDGRTVTSANIDLSVATSFSNAAALMQTGLRTLGGIFQGQASQTAASSTLTVSSVASGALHVGDVITGTGVAVNTSIVAQLTGTPGGVGTYTVSNTTGFAATTVSVTSGASVTWDSQRKAFVITSATTGVNSSLDTFATGTLSQGVKLREVDGGVLSQGAAAATPALVLGDIINQTQNWALFMTLAEFTTQEMLEFADWANSSGQRYAYVGWESSAGPAAGADANCFAMLTENYNGVISVWGLTGNDGAIAKAAFICGMTAAINFSETNGRITYAYKSQGGLSPDVTDATTAQNLLANGYNFYGAYATANDQFQFLQNGQISGAWSWIDAYVNQIKLNSDLQLAFVAVLSQTKSIPYITRGYDLLRAAALGPINAALNFGSIVAGVNLSVAQRVAVNSAANNPNVADVLQSRGWFLLIRDADAVTRSNRGSPPMTLWYTDGGSIQRINLASIDVQ